LGGGKFLVSVKTFIGIIIVSSKQATAAAARKCLRGAELYLDNENSMNDNKQ